MKRLLVAATTPVVALALALSATPAQAAAVKDKDVVSLATVAKSYPKLADGQRAVVSLGSFDVPTSCKKSVKLKTKSGRSAAYVGTDPAAPVVGTDVGQMKSVKLAKRVLKGTRLLSKCKRVTTDGMTATVKKIAAPKLGQERVAMSVTLKQNDTKIVLDLYSFRQKGRVVQMSVAYVGTTPQRKNSTALAKKVYKAGL